MLLAPLIYTVLRIFNVIVDLYFYVIIIAVVASWLVAFGVLNTYNPTARSILRVLEGLTEPVFRRVRRIVPPLGGLDLSPLIVLLLLEALQMLVNSYLPMLIVA